MLEIKGLNSWYGESHILHGVDFGVREGEVVTLLGRNGAGKTTTMKSIMGLVPRREGSIKFRGAETIRLQSNMIARAGIAICPEERGIFGSLSVTENMMLPPVIAPGGLEPRGPSTRCSRTSRNAPARRRARSFRAASSRCWRSRASCAPGPRCCFWTSRPRAWRRSSCSRSAAPSARSRTRGFTVLLVEQNFRFAATVADRHYVMDHGK